MEVSLLEKQLVARGRNTEISVGRELTRVTCRAHGLATSVQFMNAIKVTANDNISISNHSVCQADGVSRARV